MARTLGRQLNTLVEASLDNTDQDQSWVAVEIDASVHTLTLFGVYPFLQVGRNANNNAVVEFRVDIWRGLRLQQGPAATLASQIDASSAIEKLWGMAYQKGSSWSTPFGAPMEFPAGHVYTIALDISFEVVLGAGEVINQGLTAHGILRPAEVGMKLN